MYEKSATCDVVSVITIVIIIILIIIIIIIITPRPGNTELMASGGECHLMG